MAQASESPFAADDDISRDFDVEHHAETIEHAAHQPQSSSSSSSAASSTSRSSSSTATSAEHNSMSGTRSGDGRRSWRHDEQESYEQPAPSSPGEEIARMETKETERRMEHPTHRDVVRLALKERIRHFTWTWFTMTMATGGIANVLHTVPWQFNGLYTIGCIFFILNIVLFLFNICMISLRFYIYPSTFRASFLHPTESLFIPAAIISFGTILLNISQYGVNSTGHWLNTGMLVLFWIYCALAIMLSIGIFLIMWSTQTFTISQMTPVWIFPAYPLLIVGPHAGNLASKVSDSHALDIIVGGVVLQGIGFMVSLMIYSAFLYRLMTQKLPKESLRPGMFISVGPSGFTISGIINMGQALIKVIPDDFMGEGNGPLAGQVSRILANWAGIWLWGLAFWFFFVSVGAHMSCVAHGKMDFAMTWYSFIFPNTALTTATFAVATALNNNRSINIVGCVLTVALIITWFFVFGMMLRAVILKQILWPQKQEDREEGGWKELAIHTQQRDSRRPPQMATADQLHLEPEHETVGRRRAASNAVRRVVRDRVRDIRVLTDSSTI